MGCLKNKQQCYSESLPVISLISFNLYNQIVFNLPECSHEFLFNRIMLNDPLYNLVQII